MKTSDTTEDTLKFLSNLLILLVGLEKRNRGGGGGGGDTFLPEIFELLKLQKMQLGTLAVLKYIAIIRLITIRSDFLLRDFFCLGFVQKFSFLRHFSLHEPTISCNPFVTKLHLT